MRAAKFGFVLSAALHAGAAVGIAGLPKEMPARKPTQIAMVSPPKKAKPAEDKPKEPEPPKPEPPTPAPVKAKAAPPKAEAPPPPAAAPQPAAATPAPAANVPNIGALALPGGGPGGIAIPQGGPAGPTPAPAAQAAPQEKNLGAQNGKAHDDDCAEAETKPKPAGVAQPALTDAAKSAQVEGKVRVQVSIDASGAVTDAKVVAGLGYGLDEACVAAAKKAKFTPASKCGKATASTFTLVFRFTSE